MVLYRDHRALVFSLYFVCFRVGEAPSVRGTARAEVLRADGDGVGVMLRAGGALGEGEVVFGIRVHAGQSDDHAVDARLEFNAVEVDVFGGPCVASVAGGE